MSADTNRQIMTNEESNIVFESFFFDGTSTLESLLTGTSNFICRALENFMDQFCAEQRRLIVPKISHYLQA